jgi:hypothetical protein
MLKYILKYILSGIYYIGNTVGCLFHTRRKKVYIMSQVFIKDNMLQPAATMTRELAGKCIVTIPPLKKPGGNSPNGNDASANQFPYDYYTAPVSIQYPDRTTSKTVLIPEVVIYNLPRAAGNSTRYPLGLSRAFVAYFEAALKKGYEGTSFNDTRYADTQTHVWTEATVYPADPAKGSKGLEVEVSMVKAGKRSKFAYDGLEDFFSKTPFVAVRADIVTTVKIQASVTKRAELPPNAPAKPVFTPIKIFIRGKMDVPQPVGNSVQNTVSTEANNADEDFWKMMQELNTGGGNGDDEDEEDEKKPVNGKASNTANDDDEDDEFEEES